MASTKTADQKVALFADDDDNFGVYAISAVSFPSHIRTLLPASEKHMVEYMALERARRRLRNVIIALAVFAVCATLLSVSLVLAFQQKDANLSQSDAISELSWKSSKVQTVLIRLNSTLNSSRSHSATPTAHSEKMPSYVIKSRTRCVKQCWAYAAFRFRATCNEGYCTCNAPDYDPWTCLPAVDNCIIHKNGEARASAILKGVPQKVYSCQSEPRTESPDLHVLSIFGNHRAIVTSVEVAGNTSHPQVLALVNYHPVTWKLRINPSVNLAKVILVSYNHLSKTSVLFDDLQQRAEPEVARLFSQTGYGEDRYGGHTAQLLKNIKREFGYVKTFTGTSHADAWYVNLDETVSSVELSQPL